MRTQWLVTIAPKNKYRAVMNCFVMVVNAESGPEAKKLAALHPEFSDQHHWYTAPKVQRLQAQCTYYI